MPDRKPSSDVLGSLPRTRPQRRSAKRAQSPSGTGADVTQAQPASTPKRSPAAKPKAATTAKATPKKKTAPRKTTTRAKAATGSTPTPPRRRATTRTPQSPAPTAAAAQTQPEPPREQPQPRRSIDPPSGGDILQSAAHAAGELASLGLEASRRAVKGALSRLPRP